ncbi:MAG: hypothetical protein PHS33_09365 [Candidatus Omnitrophica bacterium]|nr:hypothetical protein [Candidatus Omnitrophota bacterium]
MKCRMCDTELEILNLEEGLPTFKNQVYFCPKNSCPMAGVLVVNIVLLSFKPEDFKEVERHERLYS